MSRFVLRNGELQPKRFERHPARSALPCPSVRSDGMDAIVSQADGRSYDSRSAYYASLRARGCEIVGDDRNGFQEPVYEPGDVAGDIAEAVDQLRGQG